MASLDDMTVNITFVTNLITMDKKYQTRDGRAVEILRTGLYCDSPFNVLGIIWKGDGKCFVEAWTPDGKTTHDSVIYNNDLIPVPTKHEGYAVIRDSKCEYGFYVFSTREVAAKYLHRCEPDLPEGRHIVPVTWES